MKEVVIVTGASSAIGKACAEYLSLAGYAVYRMARGLPGKGKGHADWYDISPDDDDRVTEFVVDIANREGGVHAVVNCAQYALSGSVEDTSIEEARAQFEANFFDAYRACRAALPFMREQGCGLILNMTCSAASAALPFFGFYSASCSALHGLTVALRAEVAPFGISVVLIETGGIDAETIGARIETADSQKSPVYWNAYRTALRMPGQQDAAPSPTAIAMLVERLIREAAPKEHIVAGERIPWMGPTLKQVLDDRAQGGSRQGYGQAEHLVGLAHAANRSEDFIGFTGEWNQHDKQVLREAIYEFEVRVQLRGEISAPHSWICSCRHLRTRSIFTANRRGYGSILTSHTAKDLAEQIESWGNRLKVGRLTHLEAQGRNEL